MSTAPPAINVEPAWEIAMLFPPQGEWTEEEYLDLTRDTNHLVEFSDGRIEVLSMPTTSHQLIVRALVDVLRAFVEPRNLGDVLFAPLRVRTRGRKFREPDVVFMLSEHADRVGEEFWEGADLVMEVVSSDPESRERDLDKKPIDYAAAGIPEYWIVDPHTERISVLKLSDQQYEVHCDCGIGDQANSVLLEGFAVDVAKVLGAAGSRH
jgi:Uma2 family endonuclease